MRGNRGPRLGPEDRGWGRRASAGTGGTERVGLVAPTRAWQACARPSRPSLSRVSPSNRGCTVSDPRVVEPLMAPPDATVVVPGSKSLTNRALVAAALAQGTSQLTGVLDADDTNAMMSCLRSLGFAVEHDPTNASAAVHGQGGTIPATEATVDVRLSGTTARFLAPLLALGRGSYVLDGAPAFRLRPMAPLFAALRDLGATVEEHDEPGHLPATIRASGHLDTTVRVSGDVSSQFLSGLLLAAPATDDGLEIEVTTPLVSVPYVGLTTATMERFGAQVERPDPQRFVVAPTGYRAAAYPIEPDASAASYLFAAAAITGGRVRVARLTRAALQGDVAFVDVLEQMGAEVVDDPDGLEVRGTGRLQGIEVDLADLSDVAQTLAAVAVFADAPTRVRGIGFIRGKETDRIAATVTELRRCGIEAEEEPDGFVVHPGTPRPATVRTYEDHRMAMSFALLGLVVPGIAIADPGCVAKTFPRYFEVLDELRRPRTSAARG
jgi:3-phosphoshikimate 1-carboxyvinyltransferase